MLAIHSGNVVLDDKFALSVHASMVRIGTYIRT